MSSIKLTDEELRSGLWKKLRSHYESKLNAIRRINDHHNSPEETAHNRGKIAAHKELLKLDPEWKD